MTINTDLAIFYAKHAATYEQQFYGQAQQQADLAVLKEHLRALLQDQTVLELACGTGYWTAQIAEYARSVLATDIAPEMLAIAETKKLPDAKVKLVQANAFDLPSDIPANTFSACFAGFLWAHAKREDQVRFMEDIRARLGKEGLVVMVDDSYVEGHTIPIAKTDLEGNTSQILRTPDGERHEVLKNFPTDSGLRKKLGPILKDIRITRLGHYWVLSGKFK